MSLTQELTRYFEQAVRARGLQYYQGHNGAKVSFGDAREVQAIVSGSEDYAVRLTREQNEITGSCECPYAQDGAPCKHLWAVVMMAERDGYLKDENGYGKLTFKLDAPLEEVDEWEEEDEWENEYGEEAADTLEPANPLAKLGTNFNDVLSGLKDFINLKGALKPKVPSWKDQLAELGKESKDAAVLASVKPDWPTTREVLYVLDVPGTLSGGQPVIEIFYRDRKKDGLWGVAKNKPITRIQLAEITDSHDRQILAYCAGASQHYGHEGYYTSYSYSHSDRYNNLPQRVRLSPPLPEMVLPLIFQSGRGRLRERTSLPEAHWGMPEWDAGEPWDFRLLVDPTPQGWELRGILARGEDTMPLTEPLVLLGSGFLFTKKMAARVDMHGAFDWVALMRRESRILVPYEQREELLQMLLRYPDLPPLDLPEDYRYDEITMVPRPLLTIRKPEKMAAGFQPDRLRGVLSFDYGGRVVRSDHATRGFYEPEEKRFIVRDRPYETSAQNLLGQNGFRYKLPDFYNKEGGWEIAPNRLPKAVRDLVGLGWHVEAEGKVFRSAGEFKINVQSGIDWFELHGSVNFGVTKASLPELLAALQRGESVVKLDDGTFGTLPEEWLNKFGLLVNLGKDEGDHIRFTKSQVAVLDALLAAQPEADFDAAFAAARDRIRTFSGVAVVEQPATFVGELRSYQKEGLGWMHFLTEFGFGGCLADDMGVGKTAQVLAMLEGRRALRAEEREKERQKDGETKAAAKGKNGKNLEVAMQANANASPSLVVVPKSLVFNWMAESAKFTPQLRVLDHTGALRDKTTENFQNYDIVLTTYGTLRNDAVTFREMEFDYVILDEAQAIKNASTASAKAARLLNGKHKLALSGTPIENHLGELWSLFEFLNPGMLGASSVFKMNGAGARNPEEETRKLLASALRPFILRRTKSQVAKELPAKVEQTLFCELEPKQRKLYNDLRDHYRQALLGRIEKEGMGKSKILILEALLRLRQASCHPGLIDKKRATDSSAKFEMLLTQLESVVEEGHKALIFSQFTSLLALLKGHLEEAGITYEYLDGQTSDRQARVERFQTDPDCPLFLISLKAGGLGLNLTAAEYVFLLDPWWNPAVEAQAIDRAHRIGQQNQVFAYRLIARDTVEEKVLQLQNTKRDLADAIINADNSLIRNLGREDLELLLS